MADEIDYDALDQALRGAIRHEKQSKTPPKKKATSEVKPKPTAKSVPIKRRPAAPRGHYMDMVSSHPVPPPRPKARRAPTPPKKPAPRVPAPGHISAPPAAPAVPLVPIAYTQDGTPIVYTQPSAPQVVQAAPPPAPHPHPPVPAPVAPPHENLPMEATPTPTPAPVPEGVPLGTRSPYMVNTQVDKRPLGNDIREGINQIYGQPAIQPEPAPKEPEKKQKESAFDWKWVLTMVFVVIAGAVAGYLFYILFADKLPF